jgi:hypothetical protein
VRIAATGGTPRLTSANEVVVYDRDTHDRPGLVSAEGDRCAFVAVDDALADELRLESARRRARPRVRRAPLAPSPARPARSGQGRLRCSARRPGRPARRSRLTSPNPTTSAPKASPSTVLVQSKISRPVRPE